MGIVGDEPVLSIERKDGSAKVMAGLMGGATGDATVTVVGKKGAALMRATATGPAIGVSDAKENTRAALLLAEQDSRIILLGRNGNTVWTAPPAGAGK